MSTGTDFADWQQSSGGGFVTSVTLPLIVTLGDLSIPLATTTTDGYLSAFDWNRFNTAAGGGVSAIGVYDSQAPVTDGLFINAGILYAQSASTTDPGMVNLGAQSWLGTKTFTTGIITTALKLTTSPAVGNPLTSDVSGNAAWVPNFQLGTLDAFSRTQIWNYASNAILRLGSLASDGDATTSSSEGAVFYGQDLQGDPMDSSNFGYARIKPMRFGLYNSKAAVANYIFKVDPTSLYLTNDSFVPTFTVTRTTGVINAPSITASRAVATDGSSNLVASATTSTELGYVSGVTSSIQAQLNALTPQTATQNQYYWVSGSGFGSDITGDGTYNKPFATVAKAMSLILTAGANNRFIIKIIGSKLQEPTDIVLKPYVYICGDHLDGTYIRINGGAGSVVPDAGFVTGRCGIQNVYLGGGTSVNWDLFAIGPNIGTPSCVLVLDNVTVTGSFTYKGRTPGIDFLEMYGGYLFGTNLLDACQNNSGNTTYQGATTLSSTNGLSNSFYQSCAFLTGLTISASATYTNAEQLSACSINGGNLVLTDAGSFITLLSDVASYPIHANVSVTGTPTIQFLNDAYALAYTPATSANWSVVPTNVQSGLDDLATSGVYKTQTANTGLFGPTTGAAALPTFRALVVADLPASVVTANYANEFHVNTTYVGTSTGSYNQPYITIQAAINAALASGIVNCVVIVHNSSTENLVINNFTLNLLIQAAGTSVIDSQRIKLNGNVTISGTTTRCRIKDINIAFPGGGSPDLIDSSTGGRNYFDNVDFTGGGGIQYSGSWANWHEYTDCTINGPISIAGTPAANSTIVLWRTRGGGNFTINASNATLALYDSFNVGNVTHTAGILLIDGGRNFTPGSTITSTSNSGTDLLSITNAVLETGPGTYMQINKTGTCFYVLSNLICNEAADVLTGTRLNQGATCRDEKYVPAVPGNWAVPPTSVKQALDDLAALTPASTYKVDNFTLNGTDITNKFVTLSSAPANPTKTILIILRGCEQEYGVDYTITGSTLNWSGLGLDGFFISGNKFSVQYY